MKINELKSLLKIKESEKEKISKKLLNNVEETNDIISQMSNKPSQILENRYNKLMNDFYILTNKVALLQTEVFELTNKIKECNE